MFLFPLLFDSFFDTFISSGSFDRLEAEKLPLNNTNAPKYFCFFYAYIVTRSCCSQIFYRKAVLDFRGIS